MKSGENLKIKVPFKCKIVLYFPIQIKKCKVKLCENKQAGVFEPTIVKCLKFATEPAITILRIDDLIKLTPRKQR